MSTGIIIRLDLDLKMIGREIIADGAALIIYQRSAIFRSAVRTRDRRSLAAKQNIGASQIAHRRLRVDIELAQRFNFVAEKFQPERQLRLPGIKIDNPAADGELSPSGDLGDTLVAAVDELFNKAFHLRVCSAPKLDHSGLERTAPRSRLIDTCARRDDDARTSPAVDLH